jgi:hypothetical protein
MMCDSCEEMRARTPPLRKKVAAGKKGKRSATQNKSLKTSFFAVKCGEKLDSLSDLSAEAARSEGTFRTGVAESGTREMNTVLAFRGHVKRHETGENAFQVVDQFLCCPSPEHVLHHLEHLRECQDAETGKPYVEPEAICRGFFGAGGRRRGRRQDSRLRF